MFPPPSNQYSAVVYLDRSVLVLYISTLSLICSPGCSRVPESVFGPVKGRCRENEQELDKRSRSVVVVVALVVLRGV